MLNDVHPVPHAGQVVMKAVGGLSRSQPAQDLSLSFSPQIFPIPLSPTPLPEYSHTPSSQSVCCYCMQRKVNTTDFRLTVSVSDSVMHTADDKMQLCAAERRLNGSVIPVSKHILKPTCNRASLLLRVVYIDPHYFLRFSESC